MQKLAKDPDLLKELWLDEEFLFSGAGAVDVDGRINPLLGQAALQVHLHVARALEFFVDDLIHARAGLNQGRGNDGERATLFDVPSRAKEALGPVQGVGVHTTGEHLARGGHHRVVGAGQSRDGVKQDHDVLLVLHQSLGLFDDHFGHLNMACGGLIEGRSHHLTAHGALHLGDLLGPLVDEQHNEHDLGMVGGDGMGDRLHHHRLAALGRGHQQAALTFSDGRDHVDDAPGDVLLALHVSLKTNGLVWEEGREVFKKNLVLGGLWRLAVDLIDLHQCEVALAVFGGANLALHRVAGVEVEAANLGRGQVDVVGACQVRRLGRPKEAKAVGQDFQDTVAKDLLAGLGLFLEDGKHQLLLAQATGILDFEGTSKFNQLGDGECFEFGEVHVAGGGLLGGEGGEEGGGPAAGLGR